MGRFTKLWGFAHARASEDRRRFENWSGGLKFIEKNLIITKIIKKKISVGMKVEIHTDSHRRDK